MLAPLGRYDEAVGESRRALALDPLSFEVNDLAALTLLMAGRYPDAEKVARKQIAFDASRSPGYSWLGLALSFQGRDAEAMEMTAMGKRIGVNGGNDWPFACISARAGRRDDARQVLQQILQSDQTTGPVDRRLFMIDACLGDKDSALKYAEKMHAEHDPLLPTMLNYPVTAGLRTDPRFTTLRQGIGLPR